MKEKYIRVGTTYYKIVDSPLLSGDFRERRAVWSHEIIKNDHGKEFVAQIPKYDGFCIVPSHTDYHERVGNFLNLYEPFAHSSVEGNCPNICQFLGHIFGEQYELGLDYLQLLYLQPTIKLPILLLVSKERNTGKTTFLNFLKAIFGGNMTFNTNEDFRSQFNSDWANKLIVAVDEVLLDKREDSERLKNLSTALLHKSEAKGKDRSEIQFFGKFILCSNNETTPVIIDAGETRYWVRKIEPFARENTNMLRCLTAEIPQFLFLLSKRKMSTGRASRMWFDPKIYRTDAMKRIINYNRNRLEVELRELFLEIMDTEEASEVAFCLNDLIPLLNRLFIKAEKNHLRKIVQFDWKLEPAANSLTYSTYEFKPEGGYSQIRRVGRHYTVTRQFLNSVF